ncbi:MAG: signal recognition particle protein, partial [Thiovulaceae bacterium]|nr:signal recognition particle protein [Sulfurimonadaceae bacterium]
ISQVEVNSAMKKFKNSAKMMKKFSGKNGMKQMQDMMSQMPGGGAGGFPR